MSALFVYASAVGAAAAVLCGAIWCFSRRASGVVVACREVLPEVRILSRTRVGVGRSLVIVEVEGRRILLGSTRAQWCAIAELPSASAAERGPLDAIDAELERAAKAVRIRGWKR